MVYGEFEIPEFKSKSDIINFIKIIGYSYMCSRPDKIVEKYGSFHYSGSFNGFIWNDKLLYIASYTELLILCIHVLNVHNSEEAISGKSALLQRNEYLKMLRELNVSEVKLDHIYWSNHVSVLRGGEN